MGLWTLLLGLGVKGEMWCGLMASSNRVGYCRYEPGLEVGGCCGLDVALI